MSNKISSDKKNHKYFIGYLSDDHKIKSLFILLPKTSVYEKSYDGQIKWICFLIEDGDLFEKYNTI